MEDYNLGHEIKHLKKYEKNLKVNFNVKELKLKSLVRNENKKLYKSKINIIIRRKFILYLIIINLISPIFH